VCAALGAAAGVIVPGVPSAPFAALPLLGGGTIYGRSGATSFVREDPSDASRCFWNSHSQGIEGPWQIDDNAAHVCGLLTAAEPSGGGPVSLPWRNTYDGYSSSVDNFVSMISPDADRTIDARELLFAGAIVWQGGTYVPRTWTMPTIASMDAAIALANAGKALSLPGSGARSLSIVNPSQAPLTIADSDMQSFRGSHVIPPGRSALLQWGQASFISIDGGPPSPGAPGYSITITSEGAQSGDIWAGGLVSPSNGAVLYGFGGLAPNAPYVPGSGLYGFTFNPLPPGASHIVLATFVNGVQAVIAGNPGGPSTCTIVCDSIPSGAWGDSTAFELAVVLVAPPIS
jgi:hypothetical protein